MENHNNITSSDGSEQQALPIYDMPVTLKKEGSEATNSSSSGRMVSGATLRKEYIYQKRDEYIEEFKEAPTAAIMSLFTQDAIKLYLKEGDYIVREGVAMYLGIG